MSQWIRSAWGPEHEADIGPLISGDRARILAAVETGVAHLYRVSGDSYAGKLLLEFRTGGWCHVLAYAGRGVAGGLRDMVAICRGNGYSRITCRPHSAAHRRLYRMIGWQDRGDLMECEA